MSLQDRFLGCLYGLACGDAVGTSLEFKPRGSFEPLTDMVGGGPFHLEPGQWTDDTSMALCLATSLVESNGFDPRDQMERYCAWRDTGYLSSTGRCFDIGNTIASALDAYRRTGNPFSGSTDPQTAGNGCIMRLAPVPMFYHPDLSRCVHSSGESARTTHGARECIDASRFLGFLLHRALEGVPKDEVLAAKGFPHETRPLSGKVLSIANGEYLRKSESEIAGTGYVVKSLEAALWCFDRSSSFREAVLMAANLGDDADTTAAVCGQFVGAVYGRNGIPPEWLERLAMGELIEQLAARLLAARPAS